MSKGKDTEIKTIYDDLSVDELKEALKNIFFYAGEFTDADMEEMNKIMTVLERKEPTPPMYTAEESWKRFQETYSDELSALGVHNTEEVIQENPPADVDKVQTISDAKTPRLVRGRNLLRVAVVAAAMVVLLFAIAVTASAMGYNIFGWVPKWNDSTIQYVPEDSTAVTSLDIPTALKQLGVEEPLFPTWLPDGFVLAEQQLHLDEPVAFYSSYFFKDRTISVLIRENPDAPSLATEKDQNEPIEYIVHNTTHYIFSNVDQTDALWYAKGYSISIFGDITIEEMKRIIDSVYEGEMNK